VSISGGASLAAAQEATFNLKHIGKQEMFVIVVTIGRPFSGSICQLRQITITGWICI